MKHAIPCLTIIGIVLALSTTCYSLEVYLPHVIPGGSGWQNVLEADNDTAVSAGFTLYLYNAGENVYTGTHTVSGLDQASIDLAALTPAMETGRIVYTDPGLRFRLAYEHSNGGLAEFTLSDDLSSSLGLFYSDFSASIATKGAAVANFSSTPVSVNLYALGSGSILGSDQVTIGPYGKVVGVYTDWFQGIPFSSIKRIVARSPSASLWGITICSNSNLSNLLFFPAYPADQFNPGTANGEYLVADHHASEAFDTIPASFFATAAASLEGYYGHTSHGSQIMTGLEMLGRENPATYTLPDIFDDYRIDLGTPSWVADTRRFISRNPTTNLVIWSWCGQLSWYTVADVDKYLQNMTALEVEFPDITFVYMTGHLDGSGPSGTLYRNNERIRSYCRDNLKILYDFADIESYDPDGTYYPNASDACDWCLSWCRTATCPDLSCSNKTEDCAHSKCFNCYRKGKAMWWLMARLSGWNN